MSDTNTRFLTITTPAGTGPFGVLSVEGSERLSAPFEYRVRVSAGSAPFAFSLLLGKSATVSIALTDGGVRTINAIITRVTLLEVDARDEKASYELELRPFLWLLSLHADCRVFQQQSVPDLVTSLLQGLGFTAVKRSLNRPYAPREYCVQYRESTLNFVSRLLEEEGIGYFFEHGQDAHTLVLADDATAHADCPSVAAAVFRTETTGTRDAYAITRCAWHAGLTPASYGLDSFNFLTPSTDLYATSKAAESGTSMSIYDFPDSYALTTAGEALAKLRLEAYEAGARLLSAEGSCPSFATGCCFTLSGHEREEINGRYILQDVVVTARQGSYAVRFTALPVAVPFRPMPSTPKPRIPSTQTAIVVGKAGEELWVDQYGRVKVQFHWDRLGKSDENSSCWIRVSQGWAGKGWGSVFLPRIGQEVVVSFIDGDPDRPLVTGAVYNAEQTLPYTLPAEQTKSTIKSQTSKQGTGKNNEIRFEDKADAEEIFIQAQKDYNLTVNHDVTRTIKHDETVTVTNDCKLTVNHDNTITVKNDRTRTVSEGNEKLTITKGTRTISVKGDETHSNSAAFTHSVDGNYKLTVKGSLTIDVTGALSIQAQSVSLKSTDAGVSVTAAQAMSLKSGTTLTAQAGGTLTAKSDVDATVQAGTSLNLKGGISLTAQATTTTVKASGSGEFNGGGMLTLKGGMVSVN